MDLKVYQLEARKTDEGRIAVSVFGLVSEVGSILSAFKKRFAMRGDYPGFRNELVEELGDALWYLSSIASRQNITLNEVATRNLAKTRALYDRGHLRHLDKKFPVEERFPRKFSVEFRENRLKGNKRIVVRITTNGVVIGDALTDNTYDPDGYRFHDAFHLAYAAVLSWSPVTRALLKRKRKSNPIVDENEDGARAIAVEEAISIFIFNQAKPQKLFLGQTNVSSSLLRTIKGLVAELEVTECALREWERAIILGYEMFRNLLHYRGGTLSLDLDKGIIEFHPPKAISARPQRAIGRSRDG